MTRPQLAKLLEQIQDAARIAPPGSYDLIRAKNAYMMLNRRAINNHYQYTIGDVQMYTVIMRCLQNIQEARHAPDIES